VLVCGFESVNGIVAPFPSFYFTWNTGVQTMVTKANLITTWFSNSQNVHCPIVDFKLYTLASSVYTLYTGQVYVDGTTKDLAVNTMPNNLKLTLYLRAETKAPIIGYQRFDILICGQEVVNLLISTKPEYKYFYKTNPAGSY
jgi:hypothetical protein